MDAERKRIQEDLRGVLKGEVRCDDLFVQLYATDASIYQLRPLGVVRPRNDDDVIATIRYAAANGIPVHARGAGSGLAGGALGGGLVIDFSRHMRRILEINDDTVRVQSGVGLAELNRQLGRVGRVFGVDPANREVSTVGGCVGVDGSGSRWPVYGSIRSHIQTASVVMADATPVRLGPQPTGRAAELTSSVQGILTRHSDAIEKHTPRTCVNSSGYGLGALAAHSGEPLNLAPLLAGSEGTLAVMTEATLRTQRRPEHVGSALLFFESLDGAARAAAQIRGLQPSACDLMDRRHLSLAREMDPRYELLIPGEAEAVLLIEHRGETENHLAGAIEDTLRRLRSDALLKSGSCVAVHPQDYRFVWQLARKFVPTLYRLEGATRPVPFVEDVAVPPDALAEFIQRAQEVLKRNRVTASVFGHASHGQVHIRPFLNVDDQDDVRSMGRLADQLYEHVWELGGTISGEHGDGLGRTPYVPRQHGPLTEAFRRLKTLFDPQGILNPGKVLPLADTQPTANLRRVRSSLTEHVALEDRAPGTSGPSGQPLVELQLDWSADEMAHAARVCNGCAACRTTSSDTRMCPIFRYSPREEASPRAKANQARAILTEALPAGAALEEDFKQVADLCVHCHMCRQECPANVDIPKLMIEAKAAYLAVNGQTVHEWSVTHIETLCALASQFHRLANWGIRSRPTRWLLEKTLGIAQGRKLPRFAGKQFLHRRHERRKDKRQESGQDGGKAKVVYFVDTYANYCDTQLGDALLKVLRHNEVEVSIPKLQRPAGMPMISRGLLDPARKDAEQNVGLLAESIRRGCTVVATEPSAVLALTHEYPMLLPDDPDAKLVAEHAVESCHYLWRMHQRGKLRLDFDPVPLKIGYHQPCHQRALDVGAPAEHLLRLIPMLRVETLDRGCSGMAGLYGMQQANYRRSLRAGLPLLAAVRKGSFKAGATECSCCKIQMEQGTLKPTIHPLKLVAFAYGLMPEVKPLLSRPGSELVVT
ncbi:MAG: anaerobic glycerol-3-phosphate dehydrogenase subunit C [Planctomycetota bacterium]